MTLITRFLFTLVFISAGLNVWSQENQFIDSLISVLEKEPENLAVLNDLAYEYTYSNLDSARILLERAIGINESDSLQLGISKETLAIVDEIQGNISEAIALHFESIKIFELIDSPKHLAWAYNGMGALYYQQYDYDKALDYFQQSVKIRRELNNPEEVAKSMINIALIFNTKEQYDSSIFYLSSALDPFIQSGDIQMESIVYSNLGSTYARKGDMDNASLFYEKAMLIKQRTDDREGLGFLYRRLGELAVAKNEMQKALAYYEKSLAYAKELGDIGRYTETKQSLYLAYQSLGDYRKAYEIQTEYIVLRDSLLNIENKSIITEYNTKYKTEQKERMITELELDRKESELALTKSENQRNIFILGTILLIVLAGSLYYRYYAKKRTSELLTEKNTQISIALEDRETLLKEIHHRVKNNLQVISSLLNLQAGSLEDEAAKEAVKEGQHRVKSMALIHQKLYSTDDIRGVDAQDYFENLFRELFTAFGVDDEKIDYHVAAQNFKLDIDTLIPLGLIVNELITNAIKYAFEGSEEGKISFEMEESAERLIVTLRDNGKGMDTEMMQVSNAFGWKMIRSLSRKLKAEIAIENDNGTIVQITIARYKLAV